MPDRPEFAILCSFDKLWVYDRNRQLEEPVDRVRVEDLARRWEPLAFLLPRKEQPAFGNDLVVVTRETAATRGWDDLGGRRRQGADRRARRLVRVCTG